jgi:transposase
MVDTETGELIERRLEHANGEAKKFYAELQKPVRVGMEATGYAQWFERMLAKLGHELWVTLVQIAIKEDQMKKAEPLIS